MVTLRNDAGVEFQTLKNKEEAINMENYTKSFVKRFMLLMICVSCLKVHSILFFLQANKESTEIPGIILLSCLPHPVTEK